MILGVRVFIASINLDTAFQQPCIDEVPFNFALVPVRRDQELKLEILMELPRLARHLPVKTLLEAFALVRKQSRQYVERQVCRPRAWIADLETIGRVMPDSPSDIRFQSRRRPAPAQRRAPVERGR